MITHPHPDHYAGLAHITDGARRPDRRHPRRRRRDPPRRRDQERHRRPDDGRRVARPRGSSPTRLVADGDSVRASAGSPSMSKSSDPASRPSTASGDSTRRTVFAGDVAYNGMHAYLADGHWEQWLATLDRLDATPARRRHPARRPRSRRAARSCLDAQRRYIETFIAARHPTRRRGRGRRPHARHRPTMNQLARRPMTCCSSWSSASNPFSPPSAPNDAE